MHEKSASGAQSVQIITKNSSPSVYRGGAVFRDLIPVSTGFAVETTSGEAMVGMLKVRNR